jgi:hypothetical protein
MEYFFIKRKRVQISQKAESKGKASANYGAITIIHIDV